MLLVPLISLLPCFQESDNAASTHNAPAATPGASKLVELLKLNLIRVEKLNERITELLDMEQRAVEAGRAMLSSPTKGNHIHSCCVEVFAFVDVFILHFIQHISSK